ncbi:MAG: FG-GAP-like repeat-containing protein [Chitinophagales bacterium]|nr:FG-GAP-like repeat-containing protein [Chitinophagales bacterium]
MCNFTIQNLMLNTMHKNIIGLITTCAVFISNMAISQSFLSDKTRQFKSAIPTRSVMPGASLDINGDLIDDIIVIDRGLTLKTILSSGKHFELIPGHQIKTSNLREWSLAAGDLNNDGLIEIITTGEYSQGTITTLNTSGPLTKKSFTTNVYAQGSSIVDINNDGWLDYFLCNEDGPPKFYINDKTGSLREKAIIDFLENDNTDGSGNYGVVWTDINGDFLPDMVLSKCKAGVDDPTDKRRINRLYINNGDGTFTESGATFNLNSGSQTWVTAVEDFDNDGDMDALVVNHYSPHQLMENIEHDHFEERPLSEELSSFSFQAITLDIDNDGLIDILLSGAESGILLHNQGNMRFDIIKNIFGKVTVHSFTVGDYNDDGFPDIHAHLGLPVNEVGLSEDQLWLNNANDNNYIKFNLLGSTSNHSAIGAHLTLYTPNGFQIRTIKGGESYGICNSLQQIFGMGQNADIDSLVVRWPSGIKEVFTNLTPNRTYLIQESTCITPQVELYDEPLIYTNQPIELNALPGFANYAWSNGASSTTISVSPGIYHVSMTDIDGCLTISKPIKVVSGCFSPSTNILTDDFISFCEGSTLEISPAVNGSTFIWQDSILAPSFVVNQSGLVRVTAEDYCGQTLQDSLVATAFSFDFEVVGDYVAIGQQAILKSSAATTNWYKSPDFENPVFSGSTFITEPLSATTAFGAIASELLDFKTATTGEHDIPISNQYHTNTASGAMAFNVESLCILHQLKVDTDTPGTRRIYILKNDQDTVFTRDYTLPIGPSVLTLDAELIPGEYTIATDERVNQANLGFKSPRLARTSGKTAYPYLIDDVIQIKTSTFGPTVYLYFYDLEVYSNLLFCDSDLKLLTIYVDTTSATLNYTDNDINITPNPVADWLHITVDRLVDELILTNLSSQSVIRLSNWQKDIDMRSFPPGMYILSLRKDHKLKHFKIIKM